jgi:hypothetical protein
LHRFGLVRSKLLAQKLIEHFSARLRALAESYGGLRSNGAGFLLPFTEVLKVGHGAFGRRHSCEPTLGSKTRTRPSQNVIRRRNHMAQSCFCQGIATICAFSRIDRSNDGKGTNVD